MKGQKELAVAAVAAVIFVCVIGFRACSGDDTQGGSGEISAIEDTVRVQEPTVIPPLGAGNYRNDQVFSWTSPSGKAISVGIDNVERGDSIYLNIRCATASKDGNEIGYYIRSERGLLEYSDWNEILTDCDSGKNEDAGNFYIPRQFYNSVAAMEYGGAEKYGVRWSDDGSDGTVGGTTISVRAVNLKTSEFIGIFDIVIWYDQKNGTYAIKSVGSADVSEYGLLSKEERDEAVQSAVDFASKTITQGTNWHRTAKAGAVVHKVDHTYFARFLNTEQKTDKFVNHWTCQDTFAVTFPLSHYGYATVYLAPQTECIGLTEPVLYGSRDMNLQVYGYDPLNPRNEETIVVPVDFFSN